MIFSPAFMGGGYIQPQLNAQGATSPPAATGPSYQVYLTNNSPVIPTSAVNIRQSLTADEGVDFDATTVPLAQQPFTIAFTATTMTVSVSFAVQQSWQHFIITSKGGAPDYNGTATVSIALSKQLPLTTAVTVGDGGLQINTTIAESDFSISTDPGTGARCWNSDAENSIATATQGAVTGVLPSSLSVNCGNLDYLRVKNLLFPGQNVIQVDTTVGLCVPYDFVVFGNFEASSGTV
jgi:hypothetical protein